MSLRIMIIMIIINDVIRTIIMIIIIEIVRITTIFFSYLLAFSALAR